MRGLSQNGRVGRRGRGVLQHTRARVCVLCQGIIRGHIPDTALCKPELVICEILQDEQLSVRVHFNGAGPIKQ